MEDTAIQGEGEVKKYHWPRVWMKACRRESTCAWCRKPILNKTYMVMTSHMRGKWTIRRTWHPDCWIAQGIDALEKRPVAETKGRKRLELSDDIRALRFKVMRRRASVLTRLKVAVQEGNEKKMIHYGLELEKLKNEIEPLGGIPEKW